MAKLNAEQFAQFIRGSQEELGVVFSTLREKGTNRFGRTLAVGFIGAFFSFHFVYQPPMKKLAGLNKRISAARATAQYADQFKDLRDRLNLFYAKLPPVSSRDRWLTETVLETMKAENMISESIMPPDEQVQAGFVFQRLNVSVQLKFSELIPWLNRVEGNKPMLHIGALDLGKRDEPLGVNGISCEIGTVIPLNKPGQ
ncbi:MAG: hypothetical protein HY077_12515 [Elusimicrobia bacterium]|nr:hypothetical protein [Elusimicrobiota bacterium]